MKELTYRFRLYEKEGKWWIKLCETEYIAPFPLSSALGRTYATEHSAHYYGHQAEGPTIHDIPHPCRHEFAILDVLLYPV